MTTSTVLAANNAQSTLAGSITNVATTANLATGTGVLFPAPAANQYFVLTFIDAATGLINEIVHVTDVTGDTIAMVRAQEGTSALPWSSGDIAANLMTAGQAEGYIDTLELQAQAGNYAVDSGTANACVATLSTVPAAQSALIGTALRIKKSAAVNTGATTINVNGFGATAIKHSDGSDLASGELPASGIFTVVFDGANYILQSTANPGGITTSQLQLQAGNYAADTGTANAMVATLSPVPASLASLVGAPVRIKKAANTNTGTVSLTLNGFTTTPVNYGNGSSMAAGDLPANCLMSLIYDGTQFVLQGIMIPPSTADALAIQAQAGNYQATDTGSVNHVIAAFTPAISAHRAGAPLRVRIANTNTAATDFDDGAGALAVVDRAGNALTAGALIAGQIAEFLYNATLNKFMFLSNRPASNAQVGAGTDSQSFVTPFTQQFIPGIPKAWVHFTVSGGVVTIVTSSAGVSSVTRASSGHYTVNFSGAGLALVYGWAVGSAVGGANNLTICPPDATMTNSGSYTFIFQTTGGAVTDPDRAMILFY